MSNFVEKKIKPDTNIGLLLKNKREGLDLDLKKVSRKLNISKDYLIMIENNRLDLLPEGVYGKKFFKKYAHFLEIDKQYINEALEEMSLNKKHDPFSTKKTNKKDFLIFPRIARNIILIIIVLACFLYLSLYAKRIFSAPEITIFYPENNLSITEKNITVSGNVKDEAEIKINNELILTDENGNFQKEINLKSGANNITISAQKKYSKEMLINRYILVE